MTLRGTRDRVGFQRKARRILLTGLKRQVAYLNEQFIPEVLSVSPSYVRDTDPTIDPVLKAMEQAFTDIAEVMSRQMDELHRTQAVDHTEQWIAQVKAGIGIDIGVLIDTTLDGELRLWSQNTASLIKGATDDLARGVSRETINALRLGQSQAQLAKTLQLQYSEELHGRHVGRTAESRARAIARKRLAAQRQVVGGSGMPAKYWSRYEIIARDQVTSLRSHLDSVRQQEAGIEKYKWKDVDDVRVRPEHAARDRNVYDWTHNHSDGHPGEPILCRCIALAVIE